MVQNKYTLIRKHYDENFEEGIMKTRNNAPYKHSYIIVGKYEIAEIDHLKKEVMVNRDAKGKIMFEQALKALHRNYAKYSFTEYFNV